MSDESLREHLILAADTLDAAAKEISSRGSGRLVGEALVELERAASGGLALRRATGLIDHRTACWNALVSVRDHSDPSDNTSEISGQKISFDSARYLTTQAYIASTWSLADSVTRVVGRILCTESPLKNLSKTPNLWQQFLGSGAHAPWLTVHVLQECFARPIAISYIVRNHFTHEGGVGDGWEFFESRSVSDGLTVSEGAWKYILKKAGKGGNNYGTREGQTRSGGIDPDGKRQLDMILATCHEELDVALGILAVSSAHSLGVYSTLLLEKQ